MVLYLFSWLSYSFLSTVFLMFVNSSLLYSFSRQQHVIILFYYFTLLLTQFSKIISLQLIVINAILVGINEETVINYYEVGAM